jgi:hypothetical protein
VSALWLPVRRKIATLTETRSQTKPTHNHTTHGRPQCGKQSPRKPQERIDRFKVVFARNQHGGEGYSTWLVQTRDTLLQRCDQVRQSYWSLTLHGAEEQEGAHGTKAANRIIDRLRSRLSANTPPNGLSSTIGRNLQATSTLMTDWDCVPSFLIWSSIIVSVAM